MRLTAFSYRVYQYIKKHGMIREGDTVITGLSGGADSVCLFLCLNEIRQKLPFSLMAIHVNHGIRGEEAAKDEGFVQALCERFLTPLSCFSVDTPGYAKEKGLSLEEAGRFLRYGIFEKEAEKTGAKIAVAHQKDDQAETVLFHLIRGSDLTGLSGIAPVNGNIIRPLLFVSSEEIRRFLADAKESWCEDSTNRDPSYARNALRLLVFPELEKLNDKATDHIFRAAENLGALDSWLMEEAKAAFDRLAKQKEAEIFLPKKETEALPEVLRRRVLYLALTKAAGEKKDLGEVHVRELLALFSSEGGKQIELPRGLRARRVRGGISVSTKKRDGSSDLW